MNTDPVDVRIDKQQDVLLCTVGLYELFLANGRIGHEALSLYFHLMYTARLQHTNQVKANNEYLQRGLNIGSRKLRSLKAFLHRHGLIEYVQRRADDGQLQRQYIKVKLWRQETVEKITGGANFALEGQKTAGAVHRPTGSSRQMLKENNEMLKENNDTPAPPEPAKDRVEKPRKKADPDPRVKELIDYFARAFELRTGSPPTVAGGHWGGNIKVLLQNHSGETIRAVIDRFFSWNGRTRFSWSAFYSTFDNLVPYVRGQTLRRDKV